MLVFLRSRYIISTHSYFSNVLSGNGQIQLNLWHGCGYKITPENEKMYRGDYTIACGEFYRKLQAGAVNVPAENVIVTGLPRNDAFYRDDNSLQSLSINKDDYKKIIIWLPTYRKSKIGHVGTDGDEKTFGACSIDSDGYSCINEILKSKGYLLMIKLHPMDAVDLKADNLSNIFFF